MRRRVKKPKGQPTCAVPTNDGVCGRVVLRTPSGILCEDHGDGVAVDGDGWLAPKHPDFKTSEFARPPGRIDESTSRPITLTITAGQEVYKPIDYHSMVVGPLSVTLQLEPGEDPKQAAATVGTMLEEMFEVEFQRKKAGMLRRMRELADEVRAQAGKGRRR